MGVPSGYSRAYIYICIYMSIYIYMYIYIHLVELDRRLDIRRCCGTLRSDNQPSSVQGPQKDVLTCVGIHFFATMGSLRPPDTRD